MKPPYESFLRMQSLIGQQRRDLAAQSPRLFTEVYLKDSCSVPFSPMHDELFSDLEAVITQRKARLAVAAPRGHAKSTIVSLAFVLWCILYEKEHLILLVSATKEQAIELLRHVRDELLSNEKLRADFPELCPQPASVRKGQKPAPWRQDKFRLANGCMVMACGVSQGIRGMRNGAHRPGLIIADDLEDPLLVVSEDQRAKLLKWFTSTLLHAGDSQTNVVVIGTILHQDSLLANLTTARRSTGWKRRTYKAVLSFSENPELWAKWTRVLNGETGFRKQKGEEAARVYFESRKEQFLQGAKVLWPERESYYDLMLMRAREGRASFQAEKQNEPVDPDLCVFSEDKMEFWDRDHKDVPELLAALGEDVEIYGACDPSMGAKKGQGDYSAIVLLAKDYNTETRYVIAADIARRKPDETIERILHYAKLYDIDYFGIETNNFQELMADNLEDRADALNIDLSLKRIKSRTNKNKRIEALEPEIAQGNLRFRKKDALLLEQLLSFPLASHDDGPDALEMAFATSHRRRYRTVITQF